MSRRVETATIYDREGNRLLRFDGCRSESASRKTDVTSHDIDEGADVSDHARPGLQSITLDGVFTNMPLAGNPDNDVRDLELSRELDRLEEQIGPYILACGLDVLAPCVITTVQRKRSGPAEKVDVTVTFQEIRFAESRNVTIPPRVDPAQSDSVTDTQEDGQQQSEEEEPDSERASMVVRGLGGIGSFFGVGD